MLGVSLSLLVLKYGAVLVIVVGVAWAFYTLASAPTRDAGRLGLRGLKRQRVLVKNDGWATVEPFVRWLGVRVSGVLSDEARAKMDEQIALSGDFLGISADEYLALSLISFVISGLGGWALGVTSGFDTALIIPMAMLGAALPYLQISGAAAKRHQDISRGLPYAIDLLALAMSAGLDFPGAVRQVIEKSSNPDDPLVEEFTLILQTLNLGRTRKEAMVEFARRCPIESVKEFVAAIVQAEERGNPVSEVLQIQATAARNRRSVRAEEVAAQAGVKLAGPLMLTFGTIMGMILGPALMSINAGLG